jgi:1-acyl-sn-glycerol-3-phosphate acyltransferase
MTIKADKQPPKPSSVSAALRITFAALMFTLNTVVHVIPLMLVALVKAVGRLDRVRDRCDGALMAIVSSWIDCNSRLFETITDTRVTVTGLPEPMPDGHFLVICNHQSWVDIPVLQKLFNRRLPMLRFFLKSQLIWVPLLGLAWWALDFPFMKRYSREQVQRRPELAGRDIEATRKACAKFSRIPVSIVNFVEGTRFRPGKHAAQNSSFKHLLQPRAGGTAFVLDAMGETLDTLIDVTVVYPNGPGELGDLFANRIPEIRVDMRLLPIPAEFRQGNYQDDPEFRQRFQAWLNALWEEKDRRIERMLSGHSI